MKTQHDPATARELAAMMARALRFLAPPPVVVVDNAPRHDGT